MMEFIFNTSLIVLATISPGPDFAIVCRNALRYSQKAGVMTAFGIATGTFFHSLYCILGLAMIISRSLFAFNLIKYAGSMYLIYLGLKGLWGKGENQSAEPMQAENPRSLFQAYCQGLFCTTLNPKAILFFLAFFTVIVKPSMPVPFQLMYAVEIMGIDLIWYTGVAFFFSHPKVQAKLGNCMHYIQKCFGGFLICFGLKLAAISK